MKKLTLSLILVAFSYFSNAQCTEEVMHPMFEAEVVSHEDLSLDGTVVVQLKVTALADINFCTDISAESGSHLTLLPPSTPPGGSSSNYIAIAEGNSITLDFTFDYDTTNLPYYQKEIRFITNDSGITELSSQYLETAHIYFTPWNTVEVFGNHDFLAQKRNWLVGDEINSPNRVYINKSSLPVSDLPDTFPDDDSSNIYSRHIEGLGYSIPFLAPDTFNYDSTDLVAEGARFKSGGCGFWGHRFNGRISNLRLTSLHIPDDADDFIVDFARDIGLRDLEVDICVNRWPNQVIMECTTDKEGFLVDGNGNRTIDFDFCTGSWRDDIGVFCLFF
ncbi:MAG: hypothetical protein VXX46_04230 [Bacteroidota bacterium]|nr:hypothetical protein [Bacteroidota bacterium]